MENACMLRRLRELTLVPEVRGGNTVLSRNGDGVGFELQCGFKVEWLGSRPLWKYYGGHPP